MCNFWHFGQWPSWFSSRALRPMGLLFTPSDITWYDDMACGKAYHHIWTSQKGYNMYKANKMAWGARFSSYILPHPPTALTGLHTHIAFLHTSLLTMCICIWIFGSVPDIQSLCWSLQDPYLELGLPIVCFLHQFRVLHLDHSIRSRRQGSASTDPETVTSYDTTLRLGRVWET